MSTSKGQKSENHPGDRHVFVCQNQSCLRHNSQEVLNTFKAETENLANVHIEASGCLGQCSTGPTVRVMPDEIWYCRVQPNNVSLIVRQHLQGNQPVDDMLHPRIHPRFY
ncbi:(2Fe-2S) ferredoxin domain-containing protein [Okeania sp.]|uniref:(2Fe-2S) ferredoxin domain-containing protein n=1 Tax=Okeania sp. TaxID=3100323 RepID=UPI002B4AF791|nr:(2Fe-2S) ferredoxin domain-containing protein [Okeania sp.]MEB3341899.1 (2Fe-2S) ferredoxin domain-containing protein [Okeania sp.]